MSNPAFTSLHFPRPSPPRASRNGGDTFISETALKIVYAVLLP